MSESVSSGRGVPLYVRILIAVVLGVLTAWALGPPGMLFGPRGLALVRGLGDLGLLVVRVLKALATPLILLAVIDAFARTKIEGRKAARLFGLSALNACVAIAIGLGVAHLFNAGVRWRGHMGDLLQRGVAPIAHPPEGVSLSFFENFQRYVPESVVEPFVRNNVISVVMMAVAFGLALRALERRVVADPGADHAPQVELLKQLVSGLLGLFTTLLGAVVKVIPFAVFAVVASVVAKTGVGVFAALAPFLGTVLAGLALHAVGWYAILVWVFARRSPRAFFAGAADAALMALSCGSSLASLPVTLRCLQDNLKVSPASARLAACVGTNLNHDGIILYEAAAAIFVSQAIGVDLTLSQQVTVALSSVMAGIGIAGVPEAGLITLPLVLSAAGIPDATVAAVLPLLLPIDWLVGRGRACTNVLSDMAVATVLDRD